MAMPNLSHADLEKLKFFINFVSENPTVLNLPQLQFVKDFVEKLGGKVPAGEFKLPTGSAGGKCPFGGDASGGGASEASSGMNVDESEESDLEGSEPESEVELDMEAKTNSEREKQEKGSDWTPPSTAYDNFINTSTVYLEETKGMKKKSIKTERERSAESSTDEDDGEEYDCPVEAVYGTDEEDPIKTNVGSVVMKCEVDSDFENEDFRDENYKEDDDVDTESDDSDLRVPARRQTRSCRSGMRTRKGRRLRKSRNIFTEYKSDKKLRKPKPVSCTGKCKKQCARIDAEQRMKLCREFWELGFVERKNYLLTCIERKPLGKMRIIKRVKEARQHTNHYFMPTSDGERVRVCLDFFLKTLVISAFLVKDALENNDGNGKYTGVDLRGGSGEGRRIKNEISKQRREDSVKGGTSANTENSGLDSAKEEQTKSLTEEATVNEMQGLVKDETSKTNESKELPMTGEISSGNSSIPPINPNESNKQTEGPVAAHTEPLVSVEKPKLINRASRKGIPVKKDRVPQPVNCAESCKFKCHTKFTEEQRAMLCAAFWRLGYKRRKDFVLSRVEVHENTSTTAAEYRKTNRVRTFTNRYFLRGERGENVRVCSRFFNTTLCVGSHFLGNAQKNVDKQTGAYAGEDRRGRAPKKNKIPDELVDGVHQHIKSYPTWVPHKNYKTRFLHSSLNIVKMYSEYKEEMERQNKPAVSPSYFRKVFHRDFKLAFLQPTSKHAHKVSSQRRSNDASNNAATCSSNNIDGTLLNCSATADIPTASTPAKKLNPNISTFTGEEGGFWTQLTPNATETMRFLQQRYAPQAPTPVIMQSIYHQQQQQQQQQQQHQQQQHQHQPPPSLPLPPPSMPISTYHLPQAINYVHQPHIMNAGYESEECARNFHML